MAHYVAKLFESSTPNAEVLGQTVMAFTSNIEADAVVPILPKYGLDDVQADVWYPHQSWLNVLRDISALPGGSSTLVAFGQKVVETAAMPPDIDSIPKILNTLNVIHHINLRNVSPEEGYAIEVLGDKHYLVYHNTSNPNDAIYGFIWGLVARYCSPAEDFLVRQIENTKSDEQPGSVFEVRWGTRGSLK